VDKDPPSQVRPQQSRDDNADKVAADTLVTDSVNGIGPSQAEGERGAVVETIVRLEAEANGPQFTDRQVLIPEAMLANEIASGRRRKSRREIVRLINRTHPCASYNRAFAALGSVSKPLESLGKMGENRPFETEPSPVQLSAIAQRTTRRHVDDPTRQGSSATPDTYLIAMSIVIGAQWC
jgi:hypothetical protein